jgi:hypothetical protein
MTHLIPSKEAEHDEHTIEIEIIKAWFAEIIITSKGVFITPPQFFSCPDALVHHTIFL